MDVLITNALQMSISAGVLVVAVIIVRSVFLNRLPKIMFLALWGAVLLRLLLPFSIPLPLMSFVTADEIFSMAPQDSSARHGTQDNLSRGHNEAASEELTSLMPTVPYAAETVRERAFSVVDTVLIIWLAGMAIALTFFSVIYIKKHRQLRFALPICGNDFIDEWVAQHKRYRRITIMQSERLTTPIAVGISKPRIILPKSMDLSDKPLLNHVLMNEYYHIRRCDSLWKILLAVGLCVHWFNPLIWAMFVLANRDLELTCDEMVLRHFGAETREAYAYSIIGMAQWRSSVYALLHNGFSKNALEERIESIMKFKRKSFVKLALSVLIAVVLALGGFANFFPPQADVVNAAASELAGTLPQISSQRARNIAADHVGYPANNAILYVDEGRLVYEVEIRNDVLRFMAYVCAMTGEVLRVEDYEIPQTQQPQPVQPDTLPQISSQRARDIAQAHVGYPVRDAVLFSDNGHLTYEVDVRNDVLRFMVYVSAITGQVLRVEDYNIAPQPAPEPIQPPVQQTVFQPAGGTVNADRARAIALNHLGRGIVVRHETKSNYIKVCIQVGNEHHDIRVNYDGTIQRTSVREIVTIDSKSWGHDPSAAIGHERAAQIAIERAGGGTVIENRFCFHANRGGLLYHVKVVEGQTEYSMEINGTTGAIIKFESKYKP